MKKTISVFDYAEHILKQVQKGVTITAGAGEKANPMSISWGTLGIEWNKPLFITFVRTGRHTRTLLDEAGEFTVNIPMPKTEEEAAAIKNIIRVCGTKSGRDMNKIKELGLTPVPADEVSAPGLAELPLTLECRVLHRQLQDKDAMAEAALTHYPQDAGSDNPGSNRDFHIAYYGEIVKAYIIE